MRCEPVTRPVSQPSPTPQPVYLAYALAPDGTAFSVRRIDAMTDASACAKAASIPSLHGIEVWDCHRFVTLLPGTAQH